VGIEGLDTRRLTLRIREGGAMRCAVSTVDLDPAALLERTRAQPGMEGADLAGGVSTGEPYEARDVVGPADGAPGPVFRVAAYDFGLKRNILRRLAATGCEATVVPAHTPAEDVLSRGYDGVFLSNGPGDPAAVTYATEAIRGLLDRVPVFGICLGHQLLSTALGASTHKLPFGHHGGNHPVRRLATGQVEITSQNHNYAVAEGSLRSDGDVTVSHVNLNDGVIEGIRADALRAFSVQYHPEAGPGPHDAAYLFDEFAALIDATRSR
jgi:carbamoyl-phosphate synthase small subunit